MRAYATAVIALVAAAFTGYAQAPAQQAAVPDEGVPTFSVKSNLVIVDVTAKDKSGNPIESLKQGDFTVLEDGKPQKISVFEFQKLSTQPEPPPKLSLADQITLPPVPKTTITSEAPGQVQYHDKRLLVFFFDFSSMGVPEQLRAQQAALEYLNKQITKDDLVSIMLYTSAIQVKTDFTDNRDLLTSIIKGLPIGEMSDLAGLAGTGDDSEEDTGAAFVADESEFNIFNTDQKLAAIEQASRMLSALPEKKAFIYFAGGVSKTGVDNQAQLEASINEAVKANLAIYPIDTRGLMADPPGGAASTAGSRGSGIFDGSNYNSQRSRINDSQETLATLAADTGGKAFLDSNDIALGITQAQQELRSYYILGYYTSNSAEDGKYRRITVKLNHGLSAKLEHREGYWANKVWGKMNSQDKEQQLREALSAGDPVTDLPLAMQVDYFRISPTAYFVPVSVKIPASVVDLAAKGGAASTQFDFIGQVQDDQHQVAGNVRDFIKVSLDKGRAAKAGGFQYNAGFTLEPGKYRIKFLVRENITGKMGTFEMPFTVPDLSADTSGLKLSSVIWSSQREPLKSAVGAAGKLSKKEIAANPLIDGGEKVIPNITRVFRRDKNLYVAFDVYDAQPDPVNSKLRRIEVSMSLFNQKGAKAFEVGPITADQLTSARPDTVPVKFQVPLKNLAPGKYVCQIDVIDEAGRKFAFPRTEVAVVR
ncbi:MAG TPA: VWA domain-containing protein [Bryobacteraceae bacterium]|nr:VWA domain-containing protein [Bryobacteraceae bacterium]